MPVVSQPNARHLPVDLLSTVLRSAAPELPLERTEVVYRDGHSNDFAEIRVPDGRSLIVKRARYDWAGPRFATSRIASGLIRARTGCEAPVPIALAAGAEDRPLEAYWKIDRPTLEELWPELDRERRETALKSWGRLVARIHQVRLDGFGPLSDSRTPTRTLGCYLNQELRDRLLPAVTVEWPEARAIVEHIIEMVPDVDARVGGRSRLVHNDLHMGNVLCEVDEGGVDCVGLIDLETSVAAPCEADLAAIEVHHGTVFSQPIRGPWMETVRTGYDAPLDDVVLGFFRVLHLVNMGFYSALIGHDWHAGEVHAVAERELMTTLPRRPTIAAALA